jgi:WD40 repeat protein
MTLLPLPLLVACGGKPRIDASIDALDFAGSSSSVVAGSAKGSALTIDAKGKARPLPVSEVARWTLSVDGSEAIGAADKGFVVVNVASGAVETIAVPEQDGTPWQLHRGPDGDLAVTKMVAHWRVHRWVGGEAKDPSPLSFDNMQGAWLDDEGRFFFVDTGYGLEVRELATGALVRSLSAPGSDQRYVDAVLDDQQRIIAALWDDDGFRLWAPPESPAGLWNLSEDAPIDLAGDGGLAAVGTDEGVEIRNVQGKVQQLVATKARVVRVALSVDGTRVAAALADGTVVLEDVDVPTGSVAERASAPFDAGTIEPDDFAGVGESIDPTASHDLGQPPRAVQWSPGGKLQGWLGQDLVFVDPVSGEVRDLGIRDLAAGRPFAWSSDEKTLAVMESERIVLYSPGRRGFKRERRLATGGQHSFLDFGGSTLLVDVDATKVQAWSTDTGEPLGDPFQIAARVITGFELSADGARVVTVGDDPTVYDVATGKRLASLRGHLSRVSGVGWSSDGKQLATVGNDGLLYLWDTSSWQPVRKIEGLSGQDVVFSPDDASLLVVGATEVNVVDLGTGKVSGVLTFQGSLTSADWSDLGKVVATSAGVVYVWL